MLYTLNFTSDARLCFTIPFPEMPKDKFRKLCVLHICRTLNVVLLLGILSPHYCHPRYWALINFLDVAWLRNSFSSRKAELSLSMHSNSIIRYSWNRSRSPRRSAHVDELFPALGDEFYLRSDSLIQSYWRWHETLSGGQSRNTSRREYAKRAQGKYTKCFIYPGLGASRVSAYWLAYNVRPDAVKLTQNYVQNSWEA